MRPRIVLIAVAFLTIGASVCFASPPRDVGVAKHEAKCYAIEMPLAFNNADFAIVSLPSGAEDETTHSVAAILCYTPTVEVKETATVGAYQPYSKRYSNRQLKSFNRCVVVHKIVHIDPGLRNC